MTTQYQEEKGTVSVEEFYSEFFLMEELSEEELSSYFSDLSEEQEEEFIEVLIFVDDKNATSKTVSLEEYHALQESGLHFITLHK
tara:strand:+ start:2839 stop:3093 length:255 start_codon:yes stop_codon:yes gene_type:complete